MSNGLDLLINLDKKVDKLTIAVGKMPCRTNNNRIGRLEKVVYGAVGVILLGWLVALSNKEMPIAIADAFKEPIEVQINFIEEEQSEANKDNTTPLID